jgi:hypothetical protein
MAPNRRRREREARESRQRVEEQLTIYARLARRSWLKRTIQLTGDAEALIEYDAFLAAWGRPVASVRVNGAEVASIDKARYEPQDDSWISPAEGLGEHSLSFTLPTRFGPVVGVVRGHVDSSGLLIQLSSLTLFVGGVRLYAEEAGRLWVKAQSDLPVTAAAPAAEPRTLPRPAEPQVPTADSPRSQSEPQE